MSCCVAYMCSQRQVASSELSFFRFPLNDKDRLQQWIHNVKRKGWTPSKYSRLCSLHFTQDCVVPIQGRNRLKPDAVPTIFYPHCLVKAKARHTRVSKNTLVSKTDSATQAVKRRNFSHDHDYISVTPSEPQTVEMSVASCSHSCSSDHGAYTLKNSPSPLKKKVSFLQSNLRSCKKKLKLQEQRIRRLKQKVKSLSSVVTDLKGKLRVSTSCCDKINALPVPASQVVPAAVNQRGIRGCSSVPSKSTPAKPVNLGSYGLSGPLFPTTNVTAAHDPNPWTC